MDINELDMEELDRLIDWLLDYRRKLRGDCLPDCDLDHIHKSNGVAYVKRKEPFRRGR